MLQWFEIFSGGEVLQSLIDSLFFRPMLSLYICKTEKRPVGCMQTCKYMHIGNPSFFQTANEIFLNILQLHQTQGGQKELYL